MHGTKLHLRPGVDGKPVPVRMHSVPNWVCAKKSLPRSTNLCFVFKGVRFIVASTFANANHPEVVVMCLPIWPACDPQNHYNDVAETEPIARFAHEPEQFCGWSRKEAKLYGWSGE